MNKAQLITYWVFTALVSFGMVGSGIQQIIMEKQMTDMFVKLGYPLYIMHVIGIWKILGVIVILLPGFKLAKEWAYAGLFFVMTGALLSHLAIHDYDVKAILGPAFQTIFIVLSWYFRPDNRKLIASAR